VAHRETGGIVAAPTKFSSLPELLSGPRNWDYRYCWLRDATFTLLALMNSGYYDAARAWREWLLRAVAGDPAQVQIRYGITGQRRLSEWEVPWLPGYEGAKPVRMGTLSDKTQHDYIRQVEAFARFLGRSPDTATGDDIRRFQLAQVEQGAPPPKMNTQASALRFFFTITLGRADLAHQLARTHYPRNLPRVLTVDQVAHMLEASAAFRTRPHRHLKSAIKDTI
jgi:hypothetical protein